MSPGAVPGEPVESRWRPKAQAMVMLLAVRELGSLPFRLLTQR